MTSEILRELAAVVTPSRLLDSRDELLVYECDGYVVEKNVPDVVVFPESAAEVQSVVRICNRHNIPFVPRGAGTSLAGGCLPVGGGVMIALTRMRKIHEINLRDRFAVVEPGVVNINLTRALAGTGFHYAPDPSSQGA
ncbi:MAG: FAD-binding oxidoreductase, partial [Planctomycetaceae bacterium]|nr:FAD-binding oxidoreductase [Planctomycetaceae bacterium]